jgi:dienelactone hydrolase
MRKQQCVFLSGTTRSDVIRSLSTLLVLVVVLCLAFQKAESSDELRKGSFVAVFDGPSPTPGRMSRHIAYNLVPAKERFFVYVPSGYTGSEPYGLIVFTYADPSARLIARWQAVLDTRKYIFVAAENAGNDQPSGRRLGLAVMAALEMMRTYRIDPNRVYAAGFSGGARMSGLLGFHQPDVFRGTLQNCGADFYKPVPIVDATTQLDTAGQPYGHLDASDAEVRGARKVRFVLITGTNDFRRGNIRDIFHGGFEREGFQAKLFDVPGMSHDICDAETLVRALDFLEGGR